MSYYDDPYRPTAKAPAWRNRVYAPDRIKYPMKRKGWEPGGGGDTSGRGGDEFVRISWEEAWDLYAGELDRIKNEYGNEAIYGGSYGWQTAFRFHSAAGQLQRLLALHGGFVNDVDNYSLAAQIRAGPYSIGSSYGPVHSYLDVVNNTDVMVYWGADPANNANQSYGGFRNETHKQLLERSRDNGVKHYVIDPQYSRTAKLTDAEHLSIVPGTDTALMAALGYVMLDEDLHDQEFLDEYTVGFEPFRAYLMGEEDGQPKTPEWAEGYTEIPADEIRSLAREFVENRTLINQGWAMQRGQYGEQPRRMMWALASMMGHIGKPGGGVTDRFHAAGGGGPAADFAGPGYLPSPANPIDEYIPVAKISDLLLNPGKEYDFDGMKRTYPDIQAVLWSGGNPFAHHQDTNKLLRAWRKPEFVAVNEMFWTPTADHADLVLPAVTPFERNDLGATQSSVDAKPQAIEPLYEAKSDHDIFAGVAKRLGLELLFTEGRSEMEWLETLYESSDVPLSFDEFWEKERYEFDVEETEKGGFTNFRADPEANPLGTPSGKIEIHSKQIESYGYDNCPGTPKFLEPDEYLKSPKAEEYPLHVTNPHVQYRLHSQFDNVAFMRKWSKVNGKEPVWMNPKDARERGIEDGDIVKVYNDRGASLAGAVLTERIRPSCIALSYGAWYEPEDPGKIGSLDTEGTSQTLTPDTHTSKLAQGPAPKSCLGEVEKYGGD
jgi:molybdopterin guanine dinucleotide-containing S/N-oxide reductase-like protein